MKWKFTKRSFIIIMIVFCPLFQLHAQYLGGDGDGYASATSWEGTLGAPAVPLLLSPPNNETRVPTNPTLKWNPSSGAMSYRLQVSDTVSFSTTVIDESGITETEYGLNGLANNTNYFWRVNATSEGGTGAWSRIWRFTTEKAVNSIEQISNDLPDDFRLSQNYPNPFNPTTTIKFELPKTGYVTLKVYNTLGETVFTLVSENLQAGKYSATLNANSFASGVYLYRLQVGSFMQTKKMLLVR